MNFSEAVQIFDTIVENGPLGTRLKFDYDLDPTFDVFEKKEGKKALQEIYQGDLAIAQEKRVPIILNALTFRASKNHLQAASQGKAVDIEKNNINSVSIVQNLKNSVTSIRAPIFIGAPLGSMHDAYSIEKVPTPKEAREYHQQQINIFKKLDVDFVNVVTLPSLSEAIGIAQAAELANIDYTIGFILDQNTKLLDGTSLEDAIKTIDMQIQKKPIGYLITCTHTSIISKLVQSSKKYPRLIGAQPNGSALSPQELARAKKSLSDSPKEFADNLLSLKKSLNLTIVGGCCGTTNDHLTEIVKNCSTSF